MTQFMRAVVLTGYAEVAAEFGLDGQRMLRRLDIDPRVLADGESRIPAHKVLELLELSAEAAGCESFALRMAANRKMTVLGPISLLMIHQPTIRHAMLTRMRFQRMMNEALVVRIEDRGDEVIMREELLTTGLRSLRQGYELVVGTGLQIWRAPMAPILNPLTVHFTHGPPADDSFHRAFLGPRIEFNSEFNGFRCHRADFDRPNPRADAMLVEYAERYILTLPYANDSSLANDVHGAIQVLLPVNGASVGAVAARLGLTVRTLQRRLAEAGTDFTRLRNMIRRDHAVRHLANSRVSLAEVASLLGYTQETSFSRWFCDEFGITPSGWRAVRSGPETVQVPDDPPGGPGVENAGRRG